MVDIYIRSLQEEDAIFSYRWRNDPAVWKFTGSKPNRIITPEIEQYWIKDVLARDNEKRFAICISETDEYIGNVQLTNIDNSKAEFHIFIGEKKYWGKGIGAQATRLVLAYAFQELKLEEVYLKVNKKNCDAINMYFNCGFIVNGETNTEQCMVSRK